MSEEKKEPFTFIRFGFGGMDIPLDDLFYKTIKDEILNKAREILKDPSFKNALARIILANQKYFKETMLPIIKGTIEDLFYYNDEVKLKIRFREEDKE